MRGKETAVILVNWNGFEYTDQAIRSLEKAEGDFAVIVVDNGSDDDSAEMLKTAYPGVLLIRSPKNLGFAGGNNLGLRYSIGNGFIYSFLLNNDTEVEHDFLPPLIKAIESSPRAAAVQPAIFKFYERDRLWNGGSYYAAAIGLPWTSGYNGISVHGHGSIKQVDWITGCAFLIRNKVLNQTGLLNEKLFMYSEDVEISFRIRSFDHSLLYVPRSVVYHIAGSSNKSKQKGKEGFQSAHVHYLNVRNRIWLLKKYAKPWFVPTVIIFHGLYFAALLGYFLLRKRPNKLKAVLKGIQAGLTERMD